MAKMTASELWERVELVVEEYAARDSMLDALEDYYYLEGDKEEDAVREEEGVEVVRGPHGTNAVDLLQDLLADAELSVSVPARSEKAKDKRLADDAELWLRALVEEAERGQGQGLVERAAWLAGMRGCLAARVLFLEDRVFPSSDGNPAEAGASAYTIANRSPILLQIRDPRSVYGAFGYDGLQYVVEQWTRTVGDVRRTWGEDVLAERKEDEETVWTEYWDGEVFCYWADGTAIKKRVGGSNRAGPWPHGYGGIPYVYRFGRQTGRREPEKRVRPLLESGRGTIDKIDLYDSMEATFAAQYNGDAVVVYSDDMEFELDTRPGATNYLRSGERVEFLRAGREPMEVATARAKHEAAFERATFPHTMYGADPGRVMAGYALNVLNQGGMIRIRPLVRCIEETIGGLLGKALMVAEKKLAPLVDGKVEVYQVAMVEGEEGSRRSVRGSVELDAAGLEGFWQVDVQLGDVLPADEQANLVLALRSRQAGPDGRPLMSWETAVQRFNLAQSPADERMRIDREMAWNDPEVAALRQAVLVANVKQELMEELRRLGVNVEKVLAEARAEAVSPAGVSPAGAGVPAVPGDAGTAIPGMAGMGAPGAFAGPAEAGPEEMMGMV